MAKEPREQQETDAERVPEHGTGAAAASAGDAAAALPGLPVWHWRDDS